MEGKCYYCNKPLTNRTAKRHVTTCKTRLEQTLYYVESSKNTKDQFIIKISDKDNASNYYLYIAIDCNLTLETLDKFLRDVWMECCNHLSQFVINNDFYLSTVDQDLIMSNEKDLNYALNEVLNTEDKFQYIYDFGSTSELILEVVSKYKTGTDASSLEILARNDGFNSPRDGVCAYESSKEDEVPYLPGNSSKFKPSSKKKNKSKANITEELSKEHLQEALEEVMESTLEVLAKTVSKRNCSNNLHELLKAENKDGLKTILNNLDIPFKASLKKEELINLIVENYKESVENIFKYIDENFYTALVDIKNNDGKIRFNDSLNNLDYFIFMNEMGITFMCSDEEEFYLCIPDIALDLIPSIDKNRIYKNTEISALFKGMLYYYGVISIDEFLTRLPKDCACSYGINLSSSEIDKVLAIYSVIHPTFLYDNGIGANLLLLGNDTDIDEFIDNLNTPKEYKALTKHEILTANMPMYIGDKNIYKPFVKVMRENFEVSKEDIEELKISFFTIFQTEGQEALIKYILGNFNLPQYIEQEIITAINQTCNKIPYWKNSGFAKFEITHKGKANYEKVKQGRNELCNCGSGKKYKNCCGSKIIKIY